MELGFGHASVRLIGVDCNDQKFWGSIVNHLIMRGARSPHAPTFSDTVERFLFPPERHLSLEYEYTGGGVLQAVQIEPFPGRNARIVE